MNDTYRVGLIERVVPGASIHSLGLPDLECHRDDLTKQKQARVLTSEGKQIAVLCTQGNSILWMKASLLHKFVKEHGHTPFEELLRHFLQELEGNTFTTTGTTIRGKNIIRRFLERNDAGIMKVNTDETLRVTLNPDAKTKLKPALKAV